MWWSRWIASFGLDTPIRPRRTGSANSKDRCITSSLAISSTTQWTTKPWRRSLSGRSTCLHLKSSSGRRWSDSQELRDIAHQIRNSTQVHYRFVKLLVHGFLNVCFKSLAKIVKWVNHVDEGLYPKCHGAYRHSICVYGAGDLPWVRPTTSVQDQHEFTCFSSFWRSRQAFSRRIPLKATSGRIYLKKKELKLYLRWESLVLFSWLLLFWPCLWRCQRSWKRTDRRCSPARSSSPTDLMKSICLFLSATGGYELNNAS